MNTKDMPYHYYEITTKSGKNITIDIGDIDDWGNIQRCFTDWDGNNHRECVGWGSAVEWDEIVSVMDMELDSYLNPLVWAKNEVWNRAENFFE